jgi:hypothetical protein
VVGGFTKRVGEGNHDSGGWGLVLGGFFCLFFLY